MARDGSAPSAKRVPVELTPSRNGLGRECVGEIQRSRMLIAMAEVVCERGAGDVAVAHVVERAGVSRRTFYELFEDREACFLSAFEEAIACADGYVSAGYDPEAEWAERVRGALEAVLDFLAREPTLGRLAVVESLGAGAKVQELRRRVIDRMVTEVDAGRESANGRSSATTLTAEGVVGGVASVIHGRLVSGDHSRFLELVNPLMSMIVLPYLGPAAARKELERPVVRSPVRAQVSSGNPLKDLEMRLTYRTVRALAAVAANPGSSNRAIGEVSGIRDQGQISKLLARMEKLGLVENARTGLPKGETNTWRLSRRGEEVAGVITTRAASC